MTVLRDRLTIAVQDISSWLEDGRPFIVAIDHGHEHLLGPAAD